MQFLLYVSMQTLLYVIHTNLRIPKQCVLCVLRVKLTIRRCAAGLDRELLLELLSADDLTVFSEMQVCCRALPEPQ
jgi:hypothetical protein